MATEKREKELQEALIQAVFHEHLQAVEEAGKTLNEHYVRYTKTTPAKRKSTGPQVLDFIVEEERWKGKRKVSKKLVDLSKTHSPLMLAVETGNLDIVKMLINLEASMAFKNKDGLSALHIACNKQNAEMAQLILEKAETQKFFCVKRKKKKKKTGVEMNVDDTTVEMESDCEVLINAKERPQGWTALMYSAKHGDLDTIQVLAKYDFLMLDVKNKKQHNVFHVMAREPTSVREEGEEEGVEEEAKRQRRMGQQLECMQFLHSLPGKKRRESPRLSLPTASNNLLLVNDKKNRNILHQLCCSGNMQMLKWLLETIPELKTRDKLNQKSSIDYTPLMSACQYRKFEIVKFLTEEPVLSLVDVTAHYKYKNEDGEEVSQNALYLAAIHNDVGMAKQLIDAGCPLEEQDSDGNTVLHVACMRANFSVARVVRKLSKTLDSVKNKKGKLPVELEDEIEIPPEIKKLGPDAVRIFEEALDEGKKKIPYCSMLILGKEQMGKTSLYRQLVGKHYNKDLKRTEGIDNNTVETVDRRNIAVSKWEEKDDPDTGEQFSQALAGELAGKFKKPDKKESTPKPATQDDLLKQIRQIRGEIEQAKEREERERRKHTSPPQFSLPPFRLEVVQPTPPVAVNPPQPSVGPPSPKRSRRQEPDATSAPPPPQREPPKPVASSKPIPPAEKRQEKAITPPAAVVQDNPPESPSEGESTDIVSSPERAPQPPPPTATRVLTRRQSSQMNQIVKGKVAFTKKPLPLVLNTLDFAGQPLYRPMHHCFISRRAVYIVVFKIPDMIEFIDDPIKDLMGEVRYWVQSIHAHIYPPDPSLKSGDEAINRVILVGTHKGVPECLHDSIRARGIEVVPECPVEDLKKIDDRIKNELILKKGCNTVKHIYPVKECGGPCDYFIPVENSIDKVARGKEYLKDSGTQLLQDLIKKMSSSPKILPFLEEVHPIKWLKFEERLKTEERTKIYRNDKCQIMSIGDVTKVAVKSGISNPQQQDLALKFFHDTGKIIYLKYLPTLFLSAEKVEERAMLEDLIVLQPHWLISVMKEIVELDSKVKELQVSLDKIAALEREGVADVCVLQESWREFLSTSLGSTDEKTQLRQLCLILQAHCLIYPIHSPPASANDHGDRLPDQRHEDRKFIIPCRLPESCPEVPFESTAFYFDFCNFLPEEIYHRLICLATAKATPGPGDPDNQYSSTKCIFYSLHDTNWVMELDKSGQRLKISAIIDEDDKNPVRYIHFIHQEFLSKICDEKNLPMQGLKYYGGPEVECKEKKGGCHTNILCCVTYADGKSSVEKMTKIKCPTCRKKFDVNDILNPQPPSPEPKELNLKTASFAVKDVAARWRLLGLALGLKSAALDIIEANHSDVRSMLDKALDSWLKGNGGDCSWKFLCKALKDIEQPKLAEAIEKEYITK